MAEDSVRLIIADQITKAALQRRVVVVAGRKGYGQRATVDAALSPFKNWEHLAVSGNWLTRGYLAGFQELLDMALQWCDQNKPGIISRHEQSIKRIFPRYVSPHFKVPKDLTNTSSHDERTRFYHHEYQNKLLVGLSEFFLDYLPTTNIPVLLIINNTSSISPTPK